LWQRLIKLISKKGFLLFLTGTGMELCWIYAWAAFSSIAFLGRPFPFLEAIGIFVLAALLTGLAVRREWRMIEIVSLQLTGFIFVCLRMIHFFNYGSNPLFEVTDFFTAPRTALEWFLLLFILLWALLFWIGGVTFARRSKTYYNICSRFDMGLAGFFLLFLVKLVILIKGGARIDDPLTGLFIFPFFLLSLLSIGIVQIQGSGPKKFLPGYRGGLGAVMSFIAAVLLFAGSLVLFFLPSLTVAARMGYGVFKSAAEPMSSFILGIFGFLYAPGSPQRTVASIKPKEIDWSVLTKGGYDEWTEFISKVLAWLLGSIMGLMILIIFVIVIAFLFKWMFSVKKSGRARVEREKPFAKFLRLPGYCMVYIKKIAMRIASPYKKAAEIYSALIRWGQRSGLSHDLNETPNEFGERLQHQFPALAREIDAIITAFNHECYWEKTLDDRQFTQVLMASRKLRSPVYWPLRIKARLLKATESDNL
jgi:hypothetical protein